MAKNDGKEIMNSVFAFFVIIMLEIKTYKAKLSDVKKR